MLILTPQEPFHPADLTRRIWSPADFPDLRLYQRLATTTALWLRRLEAPTAQEPRAERRGAQRLYRNPHLDPARLAAGGQRYTASLLREQPFFLVAHDTSEVDLHGRYEPADAGPLRSSQARGYLLHNCFAIEAPAGYLLGLLYSEAWTRPWELRHGDHKARRAQDKESAKWRRGLRRTEQILAAAGVTGPHLHLLDAEGDIYENFTYARRHRQLVLIRAAQDRNIKQAPGKLWAYLGQQERLAWWETTVRTRPAAAALKQAREQGQQQAQAAAAQTAEQARQAALSQGAEPAEAAKKAEKVRGRVLRQAADTAEQAVRDRVARLGEQRPVRLEVRAALVHLTPSKKAKRRPVRVQAVYLREFEPPPEVEAVDWLLLSTLEVTSPEAAVKLGRWYRSRYGIEEVHKVLKTGLHLEQEPFDNLRSFQRFMAVAGPLATQIVRWRDAARSAPQAPVSEHVDDEVLELLKEACRYHHFPLPRRPWTVQDFVLRLARLGGYEPRRDRPPGWLVIWRGWRELQRFSGIYHYAQSKRKKQARKRCVPP